MNKYIIIGIVLVALIGGGFIFSSQSDRFVCTPELGADKEFTIVSRKDEWRFDPEEITVSQCDRISLTIVNEDDYDHGFAIDAFGISQKMPASETIEVDFVASKGGTFPFYCSVSCGSGDVTTGPYAGTTRGHFDHIGEFFVKLIEGITG